MWADIHTLYQSTREAFKKLIVLLNGYFLLFGHKDMVPCVSMSKRMCESYNSAQASQSSAEQMPFPLLVCYNQNL